MSGPPAPEREKPMETDLVTCRTCGRTIELRDLEDRRRFASGEPCRAELQAAIEAERETAGKGGA